MKSLFQTSKVMMMGVPDDKNIVKDELLERQLNGIIEKQFEELGLADLCRKIANKVVEKVKKIEDEHKEIKQMYDELGGRLDTLLADQENESEQCMKSDSNKKSIIVIDDDEEDSLTSRKNTTKVPTTAGKKDIKSTVASKEDTIFTVATTSSKQNLSTVITTSAITSFCSSATVVTSTRTKPNTLPTRPSCSTKKIESVVSNLKASKVPSKVDEPRDLNDLFSEELKKSCQESPEVKKDKNISTEPSNQMKNTEVLEDAKDTEDKDLSSDVNTSNSCCLLQAISSISPDQTKQETNEKDLPLKDDNSKEKTMNFGSKITAENLSSNVSKGLEKLSKVMKTKEFMKTKDEDVNKSDQSLLGKLQLKSNDKEEKVLPDISAPINSSQQKDSPDDIEKCSLNNKMDSSDNKTNSSVKNPTDSIDNIQIWPHTDPIHEIEEMSSELKNDVYLTQAQDPLVDKYDSGDIGSICTIVNDNDKKDDSTFLETASSLFSLSNYDNVDNDENTLPLSSPKILESDTSDKLITKIKLPEDFKKQRTTRKFEFKKDMLVYAKPDRSDIWFQAELTKEVPNCKKEKKIIVRFCSGQRLSQRISVRNMAYLDPLNSCDIELGTRIVSGRPSDTVNSTISKKYKDIGVAGTNINVMFAGVVAELACDENSHRYLVFFDDGYAQYIYRSKMFPIVQPSENVWDDVAPDCKEFVKEYLQEYPYEKGTSQDVDVKNQRPLVVTKINSTMQTEWNGSWWKSKVVSIDASLVKILFDVDKRSEWIYRGTTRLEPMYDHFIKPTKKKKKKQLESYVDEKITHPSFGISKYSLKDSEGHEQRRVWKVASPLYEDETRLPPANLQNEKKNTVEEPSKPDELFSPTPKSTKTTTTRLKRASSVLSECSEEQESSDDKPTCVLKTKKQKLQFVEKQHEETGSDIHQDTDALISSQDVTYEILSALQLQSPPSSGTSSSSSTTKNLKVKLPFFKRSQSQISSSGSISPASSCGEVKLREDSKELLDEEFIRKSREQGTSFNLIATHYQKKYPHGGFNRKHIAAFCRKHNIGKYGSPMDVERQSSVDELPEDRHDDSNIEGLMISISSSSDKRKTYLSSACSSDDDSINKLSERNIKPTTTIPSAPPQSKIKGPHKCSEDCIQDRRNLLLSHYKETYNYLAIPLVLGWRRESCKRRHGYKRDIYYKTPCDRRLRNLAEVTRYLLETKCTHLCIDMFCYIPSISCRNISQKGRTPVVRIEDLSEGKESRSIVCINEHNDETPPKVTYIPSRLKTDDVNINTDPGFLVCCACTDNCQDKSKCNCAQLTIDSSNAVDNEKDPNAGYSYRRLKEHLVTGIYECNQNCACSRDTCYNSVVQNGLNLRLQVFMTENRGWGLRCIDDIPKGTFVCTYAGQVLNEQTANREGMDYGDEYLAELDHIEVVEKAKDGYESDVPELRDLKHFTDSSDDSSDDDTDSVASLVCISSDSATESNDEEEETSCEPSLKRNKTVEDVSMVRNPSECSSSTTNSSCASPLPVLKADKKDVIPCQITLHRIPSADLPKQTITDEEYLSSTDSNPKSPVLNPKSPVLKSPSSTCSGSDTTKLSSDLLHDELNIVHPLKLRDVLQKQHQTGTTGIVEPVKAVARKSTGQKAAVHKIDNKPIDKLKSDDNRQSTRLLYNGDHQMFIIDAKSYGNVGRYMNHSCEPNVFVQNVMVDTHDLRFPWVAFFTQQNIPAYTELTWDYNYELGSVPGKIMICKCGSKHCKGRLL